MAIRNGKRTRWHAWKCGSVALKVQLNHQEMVRLKPYEKEVGFQVSQLAIQQAETESGTDLRKYAPRKYSARETAVNTIKLFVVIAVVIGLLWAGDVLFTN